MSRIQRKMYRRARGRQTLRRVALTVTVVCLLAGLAGRFRRGGSLTAEPLLRPTATPVTLGFDETVVTREVTLEALTWYGLQTGVFSTREAAESKASAYADRGAPGYVCEDGAKFRVLIACYGEEDDALAVRDRLAEHQHVEVHVHRWTLPALTLRLTGMAGQLDVAEAGLQLLRQTALRLRDEAAALDRSEHTPEEALDFLSQLDGQLRLWRKTALQRFGKSCPAMIDRLLTVTGLWEEQYARLTGASGSTTALSAALKLQSMELFTHLTQLHRLLESGADAS